MQSFGFLKGAVSGGGGGGGYRGGGGGGGGYRGGLGGGGRDGTMEWDFKVILFNKIRLVIFCIFKDNPIFPN